jgi:sugar lactone lactonase YvrE
MTSRHPSDSEPRVLLRGLAYVESPRWHEGRLWFAHWEAGEIVAVDPDGSSEVVGTGPFGLGWSIDWLPDGRLLVTGEGLMRVEPDGALVPHADLSRLGGDWNEIVVDGRGNIYVNGRCDFQPDPGKPPPGIVALVTPDGSVRQVADGIAFPNGMVVTPDNAVLIVAESYGKQLTAFDIAADGSLSGRRQWAELDGYPDGISLDAEGAIWYGDVGSKRCVRVREGGEVLQTIDLDRGCFACTLGGVDGRTLFILAAEWRGFEHVDEAIADRTGRVLTVRAPAERAGWP